MARRIKDNVLQTRTQRLKLPIARRPVFVRIAPGVSLGYRRNQIAGSWVLKRADGKGGAITRAIGKADDYDESDGVAIISFWEAQDRAKSEVKVIHGPTAAVALSVGRAADIYLNGLQIRNSRTANDTRRRLQKHFLPKFAVRLIANLTKTEIEEWRDSMVKTAGDSEKVRQSKDSANRVLSMVKALLNHAMQDPANRLGDDHAWRLVKPFKGVGEPRRAHYTMEEVRALILVAPNPAFCDLVKAGVLTGARYGELIACNVSDFDPVTQTLRIAAGKTGARTIILQADAVNFFEVVACGRPAPAPLLQRSNGGRWGDSHQQRPFAEMVKKAGLDASGTFYALRHTYISRSIEGGVPLNLIAENCGTSVRMIEKTYSKVLAEKRRVFINLGAPSLSVAVDGAPFFTGKR